MDASSIDYDIFMVKFDCKLCGFERFAFELKTPILTMKLQNLNILCVAGE